MTRNVFQLFLLNYPIYLPIVKHWLIVTFGVDKNKI